MSPRLSDELERDASRFDGLGGRDLGIDEVVGRARGIRRRRRGTALVAVAAVAAAIAIPTLLLTHSHEKTTPDPTHLLPTIDRIGLGVLPVGDGPTTGWLQGNTWHDRGHLHDLGALPGRVVGVAPVAHSLLLAVADDRADLHAYRFPVGGSSVAATGQLGAMTGGFARSPKGGVVAFVGTDASVLSVQADGIERVGGLPRPGPYSNDDAVAITGESCTAGHQCAVWVNDNGKDPRVLTAVTPGMDLGALTGLKLLVDVTDNGLAAGYTRVFDGGSCSRVQDAANTPLWHTCAARFKAFSPDGKHLLGSAAYADGFGDGVLKTFDARTGDAGLDLRTDDGASITQMRWEDDDHVLAVVYQAHRWGVLRIGLDRTVEYAIAPVAGTDDESPFLLPD